MSDRLKKPDYADNLMNPVQLILQQKFSEMKNRNQQLSYRFFAKKIGLSSGALSELMNGKRQISPKLALKIADKLCLDPKDRAQFLGQSEEELQVKSLQYTELKNDQFHLISDWPHFAILNLVKSDQCVHKAEWFAQQLNLPLPEVKECLNRLLRLELLKIKNKKFVRTSAQFSTSDDVINLSIRKSNLEDLQMIQRQITTIGVDKRDLSSTTLLIDESKMKEYKAWLRNMQDKFGHKFEATHSKSVFRLSVALYPLKNVDEGS